ncbi:MAG: hypothetical protein WCC22_07580 [Terriglobales bacterium]
MGQSPPDAGRGLQGLHLVSETMPSFCFLEDAPDHIQFPVHGCICAARCFALSNVSENVFDLDGRNSQPAQHAVNGTGSLPFYLRGIGADARLAVRCPLFGRVLECQPRDSSAPGVGCQPALFCVGLEFPFLLLRFAPVGLACGLPVAHAINHEVAMPDLAAFQ